MDDENNGGGGIGPLAAFQFGRWSAQQSQWVQDWKDNHCNPVVSKASYDQAVDRSWELSAANERLHCQLDACEAQLNASRADYERLRVWANERAADAAAQTELAAHHASQASSWKERLETLNETSVEMINYALGLVRELNEIRSGPRPPQENNGQ